MPSRKLLPKVLSLEVTPLALIYTPPIGNYILAGDKMAQASVPFRLITRMDADHYLVPSDSDPGKDYLVWQAYGVWCCECRGFLLTCIKHGTNCRHLKRLFFENPDLESRFVDISRLKIEPIRITNALGVEI